MPRHSTSNYLPHFHSKSRIYTNITNFVEANSYVTDLLFSDRSKTDHIYSNIYNEMSSIATFSSEL